MMGSRLGAVVSVLAFASLTSAQYGPGGGYGGYGGGNNYGGSSTNPYGSYTDNNSPSSSFGNLAGSLSAREKALTAHGILAALAFVIFFPIGSILIRLASFPYLWLVHGIFQLFAYTVYFAAFVIGAWLVSNAPMSLLDHYHPAIGIVVFVLLFFQPFLGLMHHYRFKRVKRRTVWSYGHLWLGRIVITLGMINGGLGMLLATETRYFVPSRGQVVAYGVVAGVMWLLWVMSSMYGEAHRRARMHERVAWSV